jgi:hypothetical protein
MAFAPHMGDAFSLTSCAADLANALGRTAATC